MARKRAATPRDSEAKSPEKPRAILREVARSPNFAVLYSNDTQIQVSPWDIRISFGLIEVPPSLKSLRLKIVEVGEVRMSPQHAKKVLALLQQQVGIYEKNFGEIVLEPLKSEV
jgi:hypothetical protein